MYYILLYRCTIILDIYSILDTISGYKIKTCTAKLDTHMYFSSAYINSFTIRLFAGKINKSNKVSDKGKIFAEAFWKEIKKKLSLYFKSKQTREIFYES